MGKTEQAVLEEGLGDGTVEYHSLLQKVIKPK